MGAALTPLLPTFNQSLSLFLSQTPVYRLDGSRQNEARIKEKVEALKVEPGRLVIPFKLM
ncbi:putative lipoprotein YceB precursor [compost metagenome]